MTESKLLVPTTPGAERGAVIPASTGAPARLTGVIDSSASMLTQYGSNSGINRLQAALNGFNSLVRELTTFSVKEEELVRRFLIRLFFFSDSVLDGDPRHPGYRGIDEIATDPAKVDETGFPETFYLAPECGPATNMRAAAERVLEDLEANDFVLFVTDGCFNGGDPTRAMEKIVKRARCGFLYIGAGEPVLFPSRRDELADGPGRTLWDWSSELTEEEQGFAMELGVPVSPGSRFMIVNASPEMLAAFFKMATQGLVKRFTSRNLELA